MANSEAVGPKEAAEMLGISRSVVLRLVESGELPAVQFGPRRVRIPLDGLRDWLRARSREESQRRAQEN